METKNDEVMGVILTEAEKERQATYIGVTPELMKDLLGKEKSDIYDFGRKYMNLKYYDYEQTKEIQGNLSKEELEKFPLMGLDMGVFKSNQNEYISVYDVGDIRAKSTEMAKEGLTETVQDKVVTRYEEIKNHAKKKHYTYDLIVKNEIKFKYQSLEIDPVDKKTG